MRAEAVQASVKQLLVDIVAMQLCMAWARAAQQPQAPPLAAGRDPAVQATGEPQPSSPGAVSVGSGSDTSSGPGSRVRRTGGRYYVYYRRQDGARSMTAKDLVAPSNNVNGKPLVWKEHEEGVRGPTVCPVRSPIGTVRVERRWLSRGGAQAG